MKSLTLLILFIMIVNFCDTDNFQQLLKELSYVVSQDNVPARIDGYFNSVSVQFGSNAVFDSNLMVVFAKLAKRFQCNLGVSIFSDCLILSFSSRI